MFQKLIPVFVISSLLVGCAMNTTQPSDVANQRRIFQSYTAAYDGKADRTAVSAQFRAGALVGPSLRLVDRSTVKHHRLALVEETAGATQYRAETAGLIRTHHFVFTDTDGKEYRNTIDLPELSFPRVIPAASRAAEFALTWIGVPVRPEEIVQLVIIDADGVEVRATGERVGATSLSVPAAQVARLRRGAATARLQRYLFSSTALTRATEAGGLVVVAVTTNEQPITIND